MNPRIALPQLHAHVLCDVFRIRLVAAPFVGDPVNHRIVLLDQAGKRLAIAVLGTLDQAMVSLVKHHIQQLDALYGEILGWVGRYFS